ncbi:MAG: hypothetical protein FJ147_08955 [Deltaproteobacteria bacterium]|nr:hypothetical protein [Deltaproteobacteria bacterium]
MNAFGKGLMIASAVATLVTSGALTARAADDKAGSDKVHCSGINACKGQGACSGAGHSCSGKNACKGQGWVETSAKECTDKGGKVVDEKK